MRKEESVRKEIDYLREYSDDNPQGINTLTLVAELLFDIREILLDIAEKQGVDVASHFLEETSEESFQPEDDGAGVPPVGSDGPSQDPAGDGISPGSDSWLADRAAELRVGLYDQPDSQG